MNINIISLLCCSFLLSCANLKMAERSKTDSMAPSASETQVTRSSGQENEISLISDTDFNKYAYELGYNPDLGLSADEKRQINSRYRIRKLERTLDSEKERRHYSKVLPYLQTDQEKVDYLSNPTIEGRQAWVIRNKIWDRANKISKDYLDTVETQDLTVGMTQDLVKKSWGDPETVEYSGNPIYKNEKWRYIRDVPSSNGYKREKRFVFFEGGRVVGWETE
jgi:hypothetical protein